MPTYHAADALGLPQRTDATFPGTQTRVVIIDQSAIPPVKPLPPLTGQIWPRANY